MVFDNSPTQHPTQHPAQLHILGRVFYESGLRTQAGLASRVKQGLIPDQILVLEHPPVFTLGRNATRSDIHVNDEFLEERGVEVHQTDRGGQVTYHGPGQVVAYPICNLQARKDLKGFVNALEEAMIRCAADYGVTAQRLAGFPGIWVDTPRGFEKLGALGIHLKQWIATHGIAFNVRPEMHHFMWITPCGITDKGVCSLYSLLGDQAPTWQQAAENLAGHLTQTLGLTLEIARTPSRSVSALVWRKRGGQAEFLMMQRQPDQGLWWSSVTGMIDGGESPESAAIRETFEETGLKGRITPFDFEYSFWMDPQILKFPDDQVRFNRECCFHIEVEPNAMVNLNEKEHSEYRWCAFEEAYALMRWDGAKAMLKRLHREMGL